MPQFSFRAVYSAFHCEWYPNRIERRLSPPPLPDTKASAHKRHWERQYGILMRVAAEAVLTLCRDKLHLGATPAILAVLHTWMGTMDYHPHVHMLVSAGGVSNDGKRWLDAKPGFLVPVKALSRLFRNRIRYVCPQPALQGKVWIGLVPTRANPAKRRTLANGSAPGALSADGMGAGYICFSGYLPHATNGG